MPDFLAFTIRGVGQVNRLVAALEKSGALVDGLAKAATATLAGEVAAVFGDELRAAAPVGKGPTAGKLRDSMRVTVSLNGQRKVVSAFGADPPLSFILFGTRPHVIEARNARALAFTSGGKLIFARRVFHPGTKPNDFVKTAWLASRPKLRAALDVAAEEIKLGFTV